MGEQKQSYQHLQELLTLHKMMHGILGSTIIYKPIYRIEMFLCQEIEKAVGSLAGEGYSKRTLPVLWKSLKQAISRKLPTKMKFIKEQESQAINMVYT